MSKLNSILNEIKKTALACGRNPNDITLLAVVKNQSIEAVQSLINQGVFHLGENRVQEAMKKREVMKASNLVWHFIGPIQSNKTKLIAEHFSWVHSVDNIRHAERLNHQRPKDRPPLNVCLQVNISHEPKKSGISPDKVLILAKQIKALPCLRLRGLMAIPKETTDRVAQRQSFCAMRHLFDECNQEGLELDTLSMGMSGDFHLAIEEGATLLRIGSALF